MFIIPKKRYMKKHVGGSGIFDTISNFFKRLISSNAAKSVASTIANAASTDIGKTAIAAAKTAGKELAKTGINTAKDVVIAKGKQLIDRGGKKILTPQNVATIQQLTGLTPNVPVITQQSKDILTGLTNAAASAGETNINKLLGSGLKNKNVRAQNAVANAVAIQDLVKRMNGSGLRLAPG